MLQIVLNEVKMDQYNKLEKNGNIGFYKSCEVTEIYLKLNQNDETVNFFTLAVLEEKPFENNMANMILEESPINKDYNLNIKQYHLSLKDSKENFRILLNEGIWNSNYDPISSEDFSELRCIPKQFVSSLNFDYNRLSKVLKNNFNNGSYILEFFNENKRLLNFILENDILLNNIYQQIKKFLPINLYIARDRIGNFIFQFPISLFNLNIRATDTWDGIKFDFSMNHKDKSEYIIEVDSVFENNYMDSKIIKYNPSQPIVKVENLDFGCLIKVWKINPFLLVYYYNGGFLKDIRINPNYYLSKKRYFEDKTSKKLIEIPIRNKNYIHHEKKEYYEHMRYAKNLITKFSSQNLFYKLYPPTKENPPEDLKDLRNLIQTKGTYGAYLWDPYLKPNDIFKTLYYSNMPNVPLRAIGSIKSNEKNNISEIRNNFRKQFKNLETNNLELNIEFRVQINDIGEKNHDRFLITPGNRKSFVKSHAYSLGTSINGFGKSQHVIVELTDPKEILTKFDTLWEKLNKEEYIVWKYVKKN